MRLICSRAATFAPERKSAKPIMRMKVVLAQVRAEPALSAPSDQPTRIDEAMPSAKGKERKVKVTVLIMIMFAASGTVPSRPDSSVVACDIYVCMYV